jgi:hypothetical protein
MGAEISCERFFGCFVGGGCFRTYSFCAGIYNLCSFIGSTTSLSPFNFVPMTTNELVWMLHALVRKWHVLGFFFFVGLFATSIFSIGTLPVLASSLSCVPIC